MSEDIVRTSAADLAAGVAAKRLSATEVTRAFLERTTQLNPVVNAVCTVNPRALEDAAECDRRLRAGDRPRPLEGVPFDPSRISEPSGNSFTRSTRPVLPRSEPASKKRPS